LVGPVTRSTNLDFFLARAAQARTEAEAATLDHVRERCRRSEAAWSALAEKAHYTERLRVDDQNRKAAIAASAENEDDIEEEQPEEGFRASERKPTLF